jgi:AcrR family transcriptional regulator
MTLPPDLAERRGYHHGNLKEALLAAARGLIAERGPQGFTLSEAARVAGVSAAAPYRHFRDRNALITELCRRGFEVFGQRLAQAGRGAPDALSAFRALGAAYLAFAREEPGYYGAMFLSGIEPKPPSDTVDAPGEHGGGAFTALVAGLEKLTAGRSPPGFNPRFLALQIWSMSHGVAMLEASGTLPRVEGLTPELILDSAVGALVRGHLAPAITPPSGEP